MTGQVRTVDGRVAGRRGQATRQKLLDCLSEMLSSSPYRDVKVIDVARRAGTSPATFYQYFPDVEGAVLEIAEHMAADGVGLGELLEGRSWAGKAGWQTAQELVDGFLDFWRRNDAILRVVDLGAAEGDKRFHKLRMKILNSVNNPLADSIAGLQSKGRVDKDVSPAAVAGSLVAMLASVASHQKGFGVKQSELKPNLALLVHLGVTGRKPTK
ncbi:TetR family transcriptional regulator [Streptomyces sp. NPDC052051]|uniref:TetR family transcriptional regulator n=1 Tax=Streptomyces sp. NPDC052051 TaxID=3154649 RepID=UPI0034275143